MNLRARLTKLETVTRPAADGTVLVLTGPDGAPVEMRRNGRPYVGSLEGLRRVYVPVKQPAVVVVEALS